MWFVYDEHEKPATVKKVEDSPKPEESKTSDIFNEKYYS